jgi:dihydroorotate dehydrogenase electron transfer subunit
VRHFTATLIRNEPLAPAYHRLVLSGCAPLAGAKAGQFVMIRGDWGDAPLLGRPMSLLSVGPTPGEAALLIKVTGRGTALLCALPAGARVSLLGPLGGPFPPARPGTELWCVAGGVGLVPPYMLAQERGPAGVRFYYGARTAGELVLAEELRARAAEVVLCTDDGSLGHGGRVTDRVAADLEVLRPGVDAPVVLAGCGPEPMLEALARVGRAAGPRVVSTQLALEAPMACGYGVCLGCNVPRAGGPGYVYVCKDGPVFEAREVYGP